MDFVGFIVLFSNTLAVPFEWQKASLHSSRSMEANKAKQLLSRFVSADCWGLWDGGMVDGASVLSQLVAFRLTYKLRLPNSEGGNMYEARVERFLMMKWSLVRDVMALSSRRYLESTNQKLKGFASLFRTTQSRSVRNPSVATWCRSIPLRMQAHVVSDYISCTLIQSILWMKAI